MGDVWMRVCIVVVVVRRRRLRGVRKAGRVVR